MSYCKWITDFSQLIIHLDDYDDGEYMKCYLAVELFAV